MTVTEVNSNQTIKEFLKLPKKIYEKDKNWIPHIKQDIEKVFDPTKNKAHATGKVTRWILLNDKQETIGRIAAFVSNINNNKKSGGIGFFECIKDQKAANLLFDTAKDWLLNFELTYMDGPVNFGEKNMFWGLLVENYTDPNSYGMNYNPGYYRQLFETYGFKTYYKQFMYKRDMTMPVQEIFIRKHEMVMKDPDYTISNVKGLSINEIAHNFREVYNSAWGGHNNFKPMQERTAQKIMQNLKSIYDPDIMVFVYYQNKPVAFYINIPELNEIFKYVNGNLNWLGKLKFLYHKWRKTPRTMVGIVFGVDKDFQGKGVEGAIIKWSEDNIVGQTHYKKTVLTWIGDFNPKMLHLCENLGATVYRTYYTYRFLFDRNKSFKRMPIINN